MIITYIAWDMWFATPQKGTAVVTSLTSDPASEAAGGTPGTLVPETAAPNVPGSVPDHAPGVAAATTEPQSAPPSVQRTDLGSPAPAVTPAGTSGADRVSTNLPGNAGGNVANMPPAVLLQRLDRYEQRLEAVIAGLRAKGYLKDAADKDAPIRLEDFNPYRPPSSAMVQKAQSKSKPKSEPAPATAPAAKGSTASAKSSTATTASKPPDKSPSLAANSNLNSNTETETRPLTSAARTDHADHANNELLAVDVWDGVPSAVISTGVPGDKRVKVYRVGDMERGVGVKALDVETQTATFINVFGKEITLTTTGAQR
ncbi:MAG: hypothetical protein ORN29_09245 [Rhodoferax sp.]|nr:hypothetical protein [Rhodoferax sp.]